MMSIITNLSNKELYSNKLALKYYSHRMSYVKNICCNYE